ncbi:MAG: 2-C-methyl-D-erythritol 4-phosphate cytidylyltransferase [Balneolaceae bacterium]
MLPDPEFILIVPAAGAGRRMAEDVPKPYLEIAGKTILEHTLRRFTGFVSLRQIIVATSRGFIQKAEQLRDRIPGRIEFNVVRGGKERQGSVMNALRVANQSVGLVAIHDAVRPFISQEEIRQCLDVADKSGAAVLGMPAGDTIKRINEKGHIVETPDRRSLWQAQTPQIFRLELIGEACEYARRYGYQGTDDSSLVEFLGKKVTLVGGSGSNFKITYPFDFQMAKMLLDQK